MAPCAWQEEAFGKFVHHCKVALIILITYMITEQITCYTTSGIAALFSVLGMKKSVTSLHTFMAS